MITTIINWDICIDEEDNYSFHKEVISDNPHPQDFELSLLAS